MNTNPRPFNRRIAVCEAPTPTPTGPRACWTELDADGRCPNVAAHVAAPRFPWEVSA